MGIFPFHPLQQVLRQKAFQPVRYAVPFKIPFPGDIEILIEFPPGRSPQQRGQLLIGKHIIFPFHPLAVRILGGVKATIGIRHFPLDVLGGFPCHLTVDLLPCHGKRLGVGHQEQRIVIEHFFKMGHQEIIVCRVPGKPAANMVKQPAPVHLYQCPFRHFKGAPVPVHPIILHQKQQVMGHGKLRGASKPAVFFIKVPFKPADCLQAQMLPGQLGSPCGLLLPKLHG